MRHTIIPVILCGGSGTRLWPLSREDKPKQFLNLLDDELSLIQETILRAQRTSGAANHEFVAVTLGASAAELEEQMHAMNPDYASHILCEPMARDTGAAVAYAAQYVSDTFGPDSIMWILPADHHIQDEEALAKALKEAVASAAQDYLTTFGILPSRPETGYGYICFKEDKVCGNAHCVERFVEKPNRETAQSYLDKGSYLWNSGMFVLKAKTVLDSYNQFAGDIMAQTLAAMGADAKAPTKDIYKDIRKTPFDKAIMEKAADVGQVAVVPCDIGWSDIGSWESLWDIMDKDENGNVVNGATLENSEGCYIRSNGQHLIAAAGLKDIVIVDTGDAIMISHKHASDDLKTMVNKFKAQDLPQVKFTPAAGGRLAGANISKPLFAKEKPVQEITIQSNEEFFSQGREKQKRICAVLEGQATVIVNDKTTVINEGQSMDIQAGLSYRIANVSHAQLRVVEMRMEQTKEIRILKPQGEPKQDNDRADNTRNVA